MIKYSGLQASESLGLRAPKQKFWHSRDPPCNLMHLYQCKATGAYGGGVGGLVWTGWLGEVDLTQGTNFDPFSIPTLGHLARNILFRYLAV